MLPCLSSQSNVVVQKLTVVQKFILHQDCGFVGNLEGQKLLNDSISHLRHKHVEFAHAAHHDLTHVSPRHLPHAHVTRFSKYASR